jgi:hypothetical protein
MAGVDAPFSRVTIERAVSDGIQVDYHMAASPRW